MQEPFNHKPPNTLWIDCELIVEFDCDTPPHADKDDLIITGLKQIGFIISHEYDIVPLIERFRRIRCPHENCERAVQYEFDVRFLAYETIGLGFGLGPGTGTFGYKRRSVSYIKTFTTRCICCDKPEDEPAQVDTSAQVLRALRSIKLKLPPGQLSPSTGVASFALILAALAISIANVRASAAWAFIAAAAVLTLLSAVLLIARVSKRGVTKEDSASQTSESGDLKIS